MKFYEFEKDFDYYALIGAKLIEEAKKFYNEFICEFKEGEPQEINLEQTKEKLINSCKNNKQKRTELINLKKNLESEEPFLILIDGDLI